MYDVALLDYCWTIIPGSKFTIEEAVNKCFQQNCIRYTILKARYAFLKNMDGA